MTPNSIGHTGGKVPPLHPSSALCIETGLAEGAVVLTLDGEMPVDYLGAGDRIITRDSGMAVLEHVSRSRQRVRAILIAAGSLGDTSPDQDMILPAGQPVLIRDWRAASIFGADQALVRADALVDGEFVRDIGPREMTLCHLHFRTPHVIYAGGLELACGTMATHRRRQVA